MFAVKRSPFDMIPQVIKRGEDDTKRPASVMRKEPNDIFKKMTSERKMSFTRADRTAVGHEVLVRYIASITA